MLANNRKLKNYLLIPKFQLTVIGYFLGLFFISTASLYLTLAMFFWNLNKKALDVGIPPGHVFFKYISHQRADLDSMFIIFVIFNFLLLIVAGMIISHRIAGPIYKLKKYLNEMKDNSSPLKFRSGDFFRDLEPVVENLRKRIK